MEEFLIQKKMGHKFICPHAWKKPLAAAAATFSRFKIHFIVPSGKNLLWPPLPCCSHRHSVYHTSGIYKIANYDKAEKTQCRTVVDTAAATTSYWKILLADPKIQNAQKSLGIDVGEGAMHILYVVRVFVLLTYFSPAKSLTPSAAVCSYCSLSPSFITWEATVEGGRGGTWEPRPSPPRSGMKRIGRHRSSGSTHLAPWSHIVTLSSSISTCAGMCLLH